MRWCRNIALVIGALFALAPHAQACDIDNGYISIFYDEAVLADTVTETALTEGVFIGQITLKQKPRLLFFKAAPYDPFYAEILSSRTHPALVGETILAKAIDESSSCRPDFVSGESGLVKADFLRENQASRTLVLYSHIRLLSQE